MANVITEPTDYLPTKVNTPETGVFLEGITYAYGWAGFIDGAIENGMTTSRRVQISHPKQFS